MRRIIFAVITLYISFFTFSCTSSGSKTEKRLSDNNNRIEQKDDGTLALDIEKASFYNDNSNPSRNTAEWNIVVSKPGRYKVWLSSATIDTMNLQYKNSVKISLQDERLDVKPVGDRIVMNGSDVKYPYFRADSFMGTFYIQEAGEYSLQVISEKVLAKSDYNSVDHTKLMSIFLTPVSR